MGRNGNYQDSVGLMNTRVKRSRRGLPGKGKGRGAFSSSNLKNTKKPTNLTKLCNANMGKNGVVAFARNTDNLKRLNENGVKGAINPQLGEKNTFDP